jgi:beta-lactamase class A
VAALAPASGAQVGVSLIELGGQQPQTWSHQGDLQFTAASTYKLPLLMAQAQMISAGQATVNDQLCYHDGEWEDGWFGDYTDGSCYSRGELMSRVGQYSDNTAAHILVDAMGGTSALDQYGQSLGATASSFYDPNLTTANDLARLWASEAHGQAGGIGAQSTLYPLLTHTAYEGGIPAGVPSTATVAHKIGEIDAVVNDAALVQNGASGPYVLVVCTDGLGGDDGYALIAKVSQAVWQFEAAR